MSDALPVVGVISSEVTPASLEHYRKIHLGMIAEVIEKIQNWKVVTDVVFSLKQNLAYRI